METVLITGASRRLGSRIAENLAADSCFVWIHYLTHREEAFDLRSKILSSGGQAECVQCDLRIPDQIDLMLKTISASEKDIIFSYNFYQLSPGSVKSYLHSTFSNAKNLANFFVV